MNNNKIKIHIKKNRLKKSDFYKFFYEAYNAVEFVANHFLGNLLAGDLKRETEYIAFWEGKRPQGVPDAVVTDHEHNKVYIYEVE